MVLPGYRLGVRVHHVTAELLDSLRGRVTMCEGAPQVESRGKRASRGFLPFLRNCSHHPYVDVPAVSHTVGRAISVLVAVGLLVSVHRSEPACAPSDNVTWWS